MKKTLSILLIAVLTATSVVGASAAVIKNTESDNIDCSIATSEPYEVVESTSPEKTVDVQQDSDEELTIPDVSGIWKHENNPNGCSIVINNQDGNTLDFTVTSKRGEAAQIATSNITVALDTEYVGSMVRGSADFNYVDSSGNGGTGSISVSENVITLIINEEYGKGGWSIANATGDYLLASTTEEQQDSNDEVVLPEIRTTWKHVNNPNGCSIVINNQNGNTLDFTVTSKKGEAAQIATSNITVTLDTQYDGSLVRGSADFNYVDSFGNYGTGSISVSENVIILIINEEYNNGGWSIAKTTGKYL